MQNSNYGAHEEVILDMEEVPKLGDFYELDITKVIKEIERRKAKKVLLQLPEGVKRFSYDIVNTIKSFIDQEVIIDVDANPQFGSCLLDFELVKSYDLVVHIGHEPYPLLKYPDNVLFVDLLSKVVITEDHYEKLIKMLRELRAKRVVIYTTNQHKHVFLRLVRRLRDEGVSIVNDLSNYLITGCIYPDADILLKVTDAFIVLAGGFFHTLGLGLKIMCRRPIIRLDPYSNIITNAVKDILKVLKKRFWLLSKAKDARSWLVFIGYSGQYRPVIVRKVVDILMKNNMKYYTAITRYLSRDALLNIDRNDIEAIIITSCPRLAIDDFCNYVKPVLTPGEFFYLMGYYSNYAYPW